MVWDDPKGDNYPYQTEFSYRMNHISQSRWYSYNITLGAVLGVIMAILVYVVPEAVFSDASRVVFAFFIGAWPTKFLEIRAERSSKVSQAAMAVTFAIGTILYSLSLLM